MARCDSCRARIVFLQTDRGGTMPINAGDDGQPISYGDGNVEPTGDTYVLKGVTLPRVRIVGGTRPGLWKAHFASCPNAGEYRKKKRRA